MSHFSFKLSSNIILGDYSLEKLGLEASRYGKQCFFIVNRSVQDSGLANKIIELLEHQGLSVLLFVSEGSIAQSDSIDHALKLAHGAYADSIIAAGDSVALTIGRAVAALYNEAQPIADFIEGQPCAAKPLTFVAIPTICCDSFSFLPFIPIFDTAEKKVAFLKLQHEVCTVCVYDPICYMNLSPQAITTMILCSISSALEGYVSAKNNFFSDTILIKAISLCLRALQLHDDPAVDALRRTLMTEAACLTAVGLHASCTGLSTAIGLCCASRCSVDSEPIITLLLPQLIKYAAASNKDKIVSIGKLLNLSMETADSEAVVQTVINTLKDNMSKAALPTRFSELHINAEQLRIVAEDSISINFMNYIPKPMTNDDVFAWLEEAL